MPHDMNGRWNIWDFFLSAMVFHDVIAMHNAGKKKIIEKGIIIWA